MALQDPAEGVLQDPAEEPCRTRQRSIVRITARVDYAVRAALELAAAAPDALTCDRIATAQNIPNTSLQAIPGYLPHARLVSSQRGREGGYRLALPPSQISIARVMRVEQGFLADVHGQRPEEVEYPPPATALASVWVAAREAYRQVLDDVTLADVVAGKFPGHVAELIAMESAWRSFGATTTG